MGVLEQWAKVGFGSNGLDGRSLFVIKSLTPENGLKREDHEF